MYGQCGFPSDIKIVRSPMKVPFPTSKPVDLSLCDQANEFLCDAVSDSLLGVVNEEHENVSENNSEKVIRGQISEVACGGHHSCIRMTNGGLYSFGWNGYSQLGLDSEATSFPSHSLLLIHCFKLDYVRINSDNRQRCLGCKGDFSLSAHDRLLHWW